jgi:ribosomal protein S27AE
LAEEVKIEYDDFGFVKNRLCPQCGSSQLRFSHKDDVGTQWFKCEKCGRYCTLTKTEERKRLEEALAKPGEPQPIMLSHLNMIEDPSLAGKPVAVEALVSSTSVAYLCPMEVEASGSDDEGFDITTHKQIRPEDPLNLQLISVNEAVKYRRLKRFLGLSRDANIQEKGYRTVYRIRVRPPVFTLEKRGEKIVDERGFEYKALDIYVVAEKPIVFQPSSLVRVEGLPLPNPKTQQTTLLAYKVDFPEENTTFDKEKLNTLKEKFKD